MLMAAPLLVLYVVSIGVAFVFGRRKKAEPDDDDDSVPTTT
jgi:Sec-independent protein secretion pathway component TatC